MELSRSFDVTWKAMERLVETGKTKFIGKWQDCEESSSESTLRFRRSFKLLVAQDQKATSIGDHQANLQPGRMSPVLPSERPCQALPRRKYSHHSIRTSWLRTYPSIDWEDWTRSLAGRDCMQYVFFSCKPGRTMADMRYRLRGLPRSIPEPRHR